MNIIEFLYVTFAHWVAQIHCCLLRYFLGPEEKVSSVDEKVGEHSSSPKPVANAVSQVLPNVLENKHEFSDAYVADASFNVGKSPPQNGTSTSERNPGARGLGDGTPKVRNHLLNL